MGSNGDVRLHAALSVPPISADDSRVYTDQLQDIEARDEAAED
jgi:hypothetical protein